MENPNLTFLSSSLLAGDRSLTNVVAHEFAHSWSGNYVTNANWSDFWLNEGFTVYIERLILGEKFKSEAYRDFECLVGYNDLIKTVQQFGDQHEFTKLQPNLNGIDPDDAFSKIPYEKGSLFLLFLERIIVGSRDKMCKWLQSYFIQFRHKSITTEIMKTHFLEHFSKDAAVKDKLSEIKWNDWLTLPGLPSFNPIQVCDQSLVKKCIQLAAKWINESGKDAKHDDLADFSSKQKMYFLDELLKVQKQLEEDVFHKLVHTYSLNTVTNVEVAFRILMLGLKLKSKKCLSDVAHFLSKHGRGLYVKPMYHSLSQVDPEFAKQTYHKNKPYYHSVIRNYCSKLLV